mgnify:CR=1 FL=1
MSENEKPTKVLFVCMGNICRSPTAHAVFNKKVKSTQLVVEVESAGTINHHVGDPPDKRAIQHGSERGYDFSGLTARHVQDGDFEYYDLILVMDKDNLKDLFKRCPEQYQHKVQLFLKYADTFQNVEEVPDPYFGGAKGFEFVLDLIENASDGLIKQLER